MVGLHFKWKIIEQLYFDPEAVNILNDTAPSFFNVIYGSLQTDFILSMSRAADPATQGKFDNLCFEQLINVLIVERHMRLAMKLWSVISKSDKRIETIRMHRDKRLSHSDRDVRIGVVNPPPVLLKKEVERVLKDFRFALHFVEDYFALPRTTFEDIAASGDGNTLIWILSTFQQNRSALRRFRIP